MSYIIFMYKNMLQELQNEFRLVRARFAVRWTLAALSLQPCPAFIAELLVCLHFLAAVGGMVVFIPLIITVSGGCSNGRLWSCHSPGAATSAPEQDDGFGLALSFDCDGSDSDSDRGCHGRRQRTSDACWSTSSTDHSAVPLF